MTKLMSKDEKLAVEMTFKATMLRAADIIDKITHDDVLDMQAQLLASGSTLEQICKVDRAMIAAAHLRACANGTAPKFTRREAPSAPSPAALR